MERQEMIQRIREYYGLQKNVDFARFFGISEQNAFMRSKKGYIDFEEIYEHCPEISPDWLLSKGQGEMLRADRDRIASENTNIGDNAKQKVIVSDSKNTERALEALAKEQEALAKSQEQISGLIDILRSQKI